MFEVRGIAVPPAVFPESEEQDALRLGEGILLVGAHTSFCVNPTLLAGKPYNPLLEFILEMSLKKPLWGQTRHASPGVGWFLFVAWALQTGSFGSRGRSDSVSPTQ